MSSVTWQACLRRMEAEFPESDINTFLRPLLAEEESGILRLLAPNLVLFQQVRKRFLSHIEQYISANAGEDYDVKLMVGTAKTNPLPEQTNNGAATPPQDAVSCDPLLPRFTFENFVVGRSNEIPYTVANEITEGADIYSPFLIYGGVGLGKTHLMQAIGNRLLETQKELNVVYLHCEQFVQSLVSSLQHKQVERFKAFYRGADVLLIDDIQFLAGKERSQEEFFHTFNALQEKQRQIVFTCDRYPKEINGLEARLCSRLGGGFSAFIEPPNTELRAAILLSKAALRNTELPHDVAFFIAENMIGSVRELESALSRVILQAGLESAELDVAFARHALRDIMPVRDRLINIASIRQAIAEYFGISDDVLSSRRRSKEIVVPRQLAMKLTHELTSMSLASIGEAFGGRDHTTVLHACQKIDSILNGEENMSGEAQKIRDAHKNVKRKLLN